MPCYAAYPLLSSNSCWRGDFKEIWRPGWDWVPGKPGRLVLFITEWLGCLYKDGQVLPAQRTTELVNTSFLFPFSCHILDPWPCCRPSRTHCQWRTKMPSNSRQWHFKYLIVTSEIMITPMPHEWSFLFLSVPLLLYSAWNTDCSSASTLCFFFAFGRFFLSLQTQLSSQEEGRRSTYCGNLEEPYSRPILICLVSCSEISFAICTPPLLQVILLAFLLLPGPVSPCLPVLSAAGRCLLSTLVLSQEKAVKDASAYSQWKWHTVIITHREYRLRRIFILIRNSPRVSPEITFAAHKVSWCPSISRVQ